MSSIVMPRDLVEYLVRSRGLTPVEARRVIAEVLGYFAETAEEFVTRRHRELQAEGLRNHDIYARIGRELAEMRFRAPVLSERQIRRIVYG
ncbi:MAG: hypothetical protein H6983_08300 [Ectothiorhodospiraceae bacterium]|nr:hypothetical protein [Chromatiales bacterium]MCP5154148.1 hypothetical protein [Ectothiorhodospiraceae bacterium]